MKTCLCAALGLLLLLPSPSLTAEEYLNQILVLTGASRIEDLTEEIVQKYERYAQKPLCLNTAASSMMIDSGLLSSYQAASLSDYRARNGDVLSFSELARIDGFSQRVCEALMPFVSLESRSSLGESSLDRSSFSGEGLAKFQFRHTLEPEYAYTLKFNAELENSFSVAAAAKSSWNCPVTAPSDYAFSASLYSKTLPLSLIIGDFNARMGEGLLLWSGFSSHLPSTALQFGRHPSTLSSSASFSAVFRGVAASCTFGRLASSLFWAMPLTLGLDLTRYGRYLHLGGSAYYSRSNDSAGISLHSRTCLEGFDIFAEGAAVRTAQSLALAGIAGIIWTADYELQFSSALRYYPLAYNAPFAAPMRASTKASDEFALALGMRLHTVDVTLDLLSHPSGKPWQGKLLCTVPFRFTENLSLSVRISERLRLFKDYTAPSLRSDIRSDLVYAEGRFRTCLRLNVLKQLSWSLLGYLETGYQSSSESRISFSSFARLTLFKVDNWDDRVYAYERDAPYNFNVPSYYGRGYKVSLLAGWKFPIAETACALYLNGSFLSYPFMSSAQKPSRLELKLQTAVKF